MSDAPCCPVTSEACCSLDISGGDQERLVAMFKALGNPLRFEILKYLVAHPGCITGDIVEHLPIAQASEIPSTKSRLRAKDRWDHVLARWGYRRGEHRVEPGLYALGNPTTVSPVFVTANYTLSFDALRSALGGVDGYILVLDTEGINVWCAAGKGTFGTDQLVGRIEAMGLRDVVKHRQLILPQLSAPGIAAHEVTRRTGFRVMYGPVRAADLPAYLAAGQATPEMREVRFGLRDRFALIPIELIHALPLTLLASLVLYLVVGPLPAAAAVTAALAGTVLFPMVLPWLPTRDFSSKGFVLGGMAVLPFLLATLLSDELWWIRRVSILNTLAFNAALCINCGMCNAVCPHGVFEHGDNVVRIVRADACMECGACAVICPVGVLQVDGGVGCAAAMINAARRGLDEPICGCGDDGPCC